MILNTHGSLLPGCVTGFILSLVITASVSRGTKTCPNLDTKDVGHFDVKLSTTTVPGNKVTTYVCQNQPFPSFLHEAYEYHALAFEPLIGQKHLVHHMLMFGCGKTYNTATQETQARTPHICGASDNACRFFLVQWSMGIDGQICSPPNAGVKFGLRSITSFSLQIHWNNANLTKGTSDSSGFRVYFTRRLRKYDVGNVQVGQNDLEIPPGQGHFLQSGSCSSDCTSQWLRQPIYLTRAHIHMHYLGVGGVLELMRNGHVVRQIANDSSYEYSRPPAHVLKEPVQVLPGDEVRLTCIFNTRDGSKQRNRTIYWGEGSDGEMCYAFISYYPKVENFNQCIQFASYDICSETGTAALGECYFEGFLRAFEMGMAPAILKNCSYAGKESGNDLIQPSRLCSESCTDAIQEVIGHPCMQGRLGKTARRALLPDKTDWGLVKEVIDQAAAQCTRH